MQPASLQASCILDWLINETHTERYIDNIFAELCERLNDAGISIVIVPRRI